MMVLFKPIGSAMRGGRGVRGVAQAFRQDSLLGKGGLLKSLPCERSAAATVRRWGVAYIPEALSRSTSSSLLDFVRGHLSTCSAVAATSTAARTEWFTPGIYQTKSTSSAAPVRHDLRLPLVPVVRRALREMFSQTHLGATIADLAGGVDAELWELAAVISSPGAAPQLLHADTDFSPDPCLFTLFVALQDVTLAMGPTRFLPGTHEDAKSHRRLHEDSSSYLGSAYSASALMDAGGASLYDSRVLHGGGCNTSNQLRALLTVTFRHMQASDKLDRAETRSMRPCYKHLRLRLSDIQNSGQRLVDAVNQDGEVAASSCLQAVNGRKHEFVGTTKIDFLRP